MIIAAARVGHQRLLHLLVEHFEMAGDVRLQRELVQHRLAEGVDGLDLQPARRFQRLGEQPPRAAQLSSIGPAAFQRFDLFASPRRRAPSTPQGRRYTRFAMLAAAARV